jgi:hypothetical protein
MTVASGSRGLANSLCEVMMIRQFLNKAPKCVALLGTVPLVGLTQLALATPAPTGASGTVAAGQSLTISGSSFGTQGPNIVMMEDFERDTAGQTVKLAGAPVGSWTAFNSSKAFLASPNAHTGKVGFHAYDHAGQGAAILELAPGGQYQEAFISVWVSVPSGKSFPGMWGPGGSAPPPGPLQFPADSAWKFAWLLQSNTLVGNQFNMIPLSYAGSGQFQPAESASGYAMFIQPGMYSENSNNVGTAWWSWTGLNRVSTWMRGNSTVPAGAVGGMLQTLNAQNGMLSWSFGNPATYPTSAMFQLGAPQYFTQINVPGWMRENSGPNADPTYDDIYIAVGPGAAARVEITDSPTYAGSKHATILRASNWSNTQVTATIPSAGLDFSGTAYLYVTDYLGNTNANGIAVGSATSGGSSGGGSTSTVLPDPPSDVTVQ